MENLKTVEICECEYSDTVLNGFAVYLDLSYQEFIDELFEFAMNIDNTQVIDVIKTFNDTIGFRTVNMDTYRDKNDKEYAYCDACNSLEYLNDMIVTDDGYRLCESCFETNYVTCVHCGKIIPVDESVQASDSSDFYCQECADEVLYFCDSCEQYFETCGTEVHGIGDVCADCLDDLRDAGDVFQCYGCDEFFHIDYEHYDEDMGESFCDDCFVAREPSVLRDYHQGKGSLGDYNMQHWNTLSPECKLGLELEIDRGGYRDDVAEHILELANNNVICSYDGSLSNGFEIVSCPAGYTDHLSKVNWEAIVAYAKNEGYVSHNGGTCGLHIHLDRKYFRIDDFTNEQVEQKFLVVFGNNAEWLKAFSRRRNFAYCHIDETMTHKETVYDLMKQAGKSKNKKHNGHSTALNFANNNTIEMRIFRGTLRYNTLVATMQLMTMWASLIRHKSIASCAKINLETFKALAIKRGYAEFTEYIMERHIVSTGSDVVMPDDEDIAC